MPNSNKLPKKRFQQLTKADCRRLAVNILRGLPRVEARLTLTRLKSGLANYQKIDATRYRANLIAFLAEVVPHAERLGLRLACHPDDPPFSILGLPRILSNCNDVRQLIASCPSPANGITLCSGSLEANPEVDVSAIMQQLGSHVHFLHLRNIATTGYRSFYESGHLTGDVGMVRLLAAVRNEEYLRQQAGRQDSAIPMRPDHGPDLWSEPSHNQPGYSMFGRLRGLAELRGVAATMNHPIMKIILPQQNKIIKK